MRRPRRNSPLLALLLILSVAALPQRTGDSSKTATQRFARRRTVKGVQNFAEVTPKLYRVGQPHGEGLQSLAKMGINTVVDVRLTGADKQGQEAKKLGLDFVALPWHC